MCNQCCGNCMFHCKKGEEWLCRNVNGDYYSLETEYSDTCDDWEEKD